MRSVLGLAIGALIFLIEFPLIVLLDLQADQAAAMVRLNAISVTTLSAFLALTLAGLLRKVGRALVTAPAAPDRFQSRVGRG